MDKMLRLTLRVLVFAFVICPIKASAQTVATQIQLNDKNIEGFIAAQKDMSAVAEKMHATSFLNQADAKYRTEREVLRRSTDSRTLRSTKRLPITSLG